MVDSMTTWLAESRVEGKVVVRVGRRGDELIAEFTDVGQLTSTPEGARAHFEPLANAKGAAVERLRSTVVDAFIRHAQGKLTLHAAAVSLEQRAVALVGPSHSGKSTLTAALCADPDVGLIGDDTVAIELPEREGGIVELAPTQSEAWLLPETRRVMGLDADAPQKTAVSLRAAGGGRAALAVIVRLEFDNQATVPELRRLRGHEAFSTLFNSAFRFVIDTPHAQVREFEQLRRVVTNCPVYELRRPRDLSKLKLTVQVIRRLLMDGNTHSDGWK